MVPAAIKLLVVLWYTLHNNKKSGASETLRTKIVTTTLGLPAEYIASGTT